MQRFLFFILSYCLLSSSFAIETQPVPDQQKIQGLVDKLTKPFLTDNDIPGTAIAVYYRGQKYFFSYGYANKESKTLVKPDTIFELASITKIFTSSLLAYEIKDNKIKLDDRVVKYLPNLSKTTDLPIDNVKILQLATHTAGFPRDVEGFGIAKGNENLLMQSLRQWKPNYLRQNKYRYSNIGFGLLGRTLEIASGQGYYRLLDTYILRPLNMKNTYVSVPVDKQKLQAQGYNLRGMPAPPYEPTYLVGGGALRSSAVDLMQFLQANLNVATTRAASSKLLSALQYAQQPLYQVKPNFVMALGWQRINRNGSLFITKNGANQGFSSFIGFAPEKKFGVVVLINKKQAKAAQLGNQILNRLGAL